MSEYHKEEDRKNMQAAAIVIVIAILFGGYYLFNKVFKSDEPKKQETSEVKKPVDKGGDGSSYDKAIKITQDDIDVRGADFASKYSGKFVEFEGIVLSSNVVPEGSSETHLMIKLDSEDGVFADGSRFGILATPSALSKDLQGMTKDDGADMAKVRVVAKVGGYTGGAYLWVDLEPYTNTGGSSPSVSKR